MKTKITLFAFVLNLLCISIHAQTSTWVGPATGDWGTASNWSPAMPIATDSVSIPATFTVTASTNVGTINRLSVSGKLIIAASGSLSIEQTASTNTGAIVNLIGGQIENQGALSLKNSVTTSTNTVLKFSESPLENKFTNSGTFSLDNTAGAYASTVGRGIGLSQLSNVSTFKMGGTMNIAIKAGCCLFETDGGGNLTLDGSAIIGSPTDFKDLRFIKILSGGSVTLAASANIILFSGFTNASNGVVNVQSATNVAPGASFTNNGSLVVKGGDGTTGYGIYFNGQASTALNTFNNNGTIEFFGKFPKGTFYIGGTAGGTNTLNNAAGAKLSLSNSDAGAIVLKSASATILFTLNNNGVINISTPTHSLFSGATISGTGTINYNYVAGITKITNFKGKVYASGQSIVVTLPSNESAKMILTDLTGRTITTAFVSGDQTSIPVNNLKGIFIIQLKMGNGVYSQKVSIN
jgi:hypothetical protein